MDTSIRQLSLGAQQILMQFGQLFAELLDNIELAVFLTLARLFLGLDNILTFMN